MKVASPATTAAVTLLVIACCFLLFQLVEVRQEARDLRRALRNACEAVPQASKVSLEQSCDKALIDK